MSAKILIVDDEKNVRLNYRITLETEGYEIFEAVSAANALEELVGRSFDLAILDMRMPAMDGLQLLAKMQAPKTWKVRRCSTLSSGPPQSVLMAHTSGGKQATIWFWEIPLRIWFIAFPPMARWKLRTPKRC